MRKKEGDKNFIITKYYEMILHLQFFLCMHLKASQNLTKEASSLSTSRPFTFLFLTSPPVACPRHRSTKLLWRREAGSRRPVMVSHCWVQRMRLSGGEQRASAARTFPRCSWAQKWRTSVAKRNPWREVAAMSYSFFTSSATYTSLSLSLSLALSVRTPSSSVSHSSLSWGVAREKNCSSVATNTTYSRLFLAWADTSVWDWASHGHVSRQA